MAEPDIKENKVQNASDEVKICFSSTGRSLDALLDSHFGRASYFLIVDKEGKLSKVIENSGTKAIRGAGVTAAQLLVNEGAGVLISGNIGPNAFRALSAAGIKIFIAKPGLIIRDVFKEYQAGKLKELDEEIAWQTAFGQRFTHRRRGHRRGRDYHLGK